MRYLSIKNLAEHQHYKDRNPPWIKLHRKVLASYSFRCLQDASKSHLMLLWVLASGMDNRIPYDLAYINEMIGARETIDIEELVAQGFIELSDDDSKPLARRKQSAMPETETYKEETETEPTTKASPAKRGGWVGRFGDAWTHATKGTYSHGRLGKELKELVARDGEEKVFTAWLAFLDSEKRQFGPGYFAGHYGDFSGETQSPMIGVGGEPTDAELRRAGIYLS